MYGRSPEYSYPHATETLAYGLQFKGVPPIYDAPTHVLFVIESFQY